MLLVSGPEFVHGYGGDPTNACSVIVFQFDDADYRLRAVVGEAGYRCVQLKPSDQQLAKSLYKRCSSVSHVAGFATAEDKLKSDFFSSLAYDVVALELTLILLRNVPRSELGPSSEFGRHKVTEALSWYETNLAERPSVDHVAQAIHLSSSHLRRLFHKFHCTSPRAAFQQIQFNRAKWLMRDLSLSLESIAERCGFANGSAFSYAFKSEFGISPKFFRANIYKMEDSVHHGQSPRLRDDVLVSAR